MTIIFSNVILVNYQMTEFDRCVIQEKLSILNVTRAANSGWIIPQREYSVLAGRVESGTYLQTQIADGKFETFTEEPIMVGMAFNLNRLNIANAFQLDSSGFSLSEIRGIEIAARFNVSTNDERWFLKAYNWTSSDFSDHGFNNTDGDLLSMDNWNDYAINIDNNWKDYVSSNGTMLVELLDEGTSVNQAVVQIDFFAVRAMIDGFSIDLHNSGALATHVVAVWIVDSAHHDRRDISVLVNPATSATATISDLDFPRDNFTVRAVTEIGNEAVFP